MKHKLCKSQQWQAKKGEVGELAHISGPGPWTALPDGGRHLAVGVSQHRLHPERFHSRKSQDPSVS